MITLASDEHIVLERRRHPLVIIIEGVTFFVIALLPLAMFVGASFFPPPVPSLAEAFSPWFVFTWVMWLLVVWMSFFVAWTNYYLDVLIITNKRIVDIEQHRLFSRDIAEMHLENVQDVKVEIIGLLASWLDFGNIHIQSASETNEFFVKNIPRPHEIRELISKTKAEWYSQTR